MPAPLSLLLLSLGGCGPGPVANGPGDSEIDQAVLDVMQRDNIPGAAVCVLTDGELDWCQGYGWAHVAQQREATPDTPFLMASASKLVTGEAARATLSAEGVVDVGFTVGHPVEADITHQMLATHTSGIADNWDVLDGYYTDGDSPLALGEFLERYLDPDGRDYDDWNNFGAPPGQEYQYSNVGNALLGYAVEVEVQEDFADWCDREIFDSLGMENTGWHLSDLDEDTLAMPYTGLFGDQEAGYYGFPDYPNGGLRSSATDMALFLEAHAEDPHEELAPSLEEGQGWVWYSWDLEGHTVWGHNGGEVGVSTEVGLLDDGRGFVVLLNSEGGRNTLADIEAAILEL